MKSVHHVAGQYIQPAGVRQVLGSGFLTQCSTKRHVGGGGGGGGGLVLVLVGRTTSTFDMINKIIHN